MKWLINPSQIRRLISNPSPHSIPHPGVSSEEFAEQYLEREADRTLQIISLKEKQEKSLGSNHLPIFVKYSCDTTNTPLARKYNVTRTNWVTFTWGDKLEVIGETMNK